LVTSHSEKEGAAGTFKGGCGFHPLLARCDETGEALAGLLRPGNAGSNTAADQIAVIEQALEQIPAEQIADMQIAVRADSAGATQDLLDFCREGAFASRSATSFPRRCALRSSTSPRPRGCRRWRPTARLVRTARPLRSPACSICRRGRRGRA